MRRATIILITLSLAASAAVAQNLHREWEAPQVGAAFPLFFSSDRRIDIPLNDMFRRHYSTIPGPGPYTGNPETFWREWDSISTAFVDTARNKANGHDVNAEIADFLLRVQIDSEGCVYSYVPQQNMGRTIGWTIPDPNKTVKPAHLWTWNDAGAGRQGWEATGGGTTSVGNGTWECVFTEPDAAIFCDPKMYAHESPLMFIKMSATRAGKAALEWTTDKEPGWSAANRVEFPIGTTKPAPEVMLQMYRQPGWRGKITQIRIRPLVPFPADGVNVSVNQIECTFDTRRPMNNIGFILASHRYFMWTGDPKFIKQNMPRLRSAAHYLRSALGADADGLLTIPYWGHEGTSGVSPERTPGFGLGSDAWDSLPMGYKSAVTNAYYIGALNAMAELEDMALGLRLGSNPYGETPDSFRTEAKAVAEKCNQFFWDSAKKRFIGCEDNTGKRHDYGFTFANLEALYYGMGDISRAADIFSWLDGKRKIEGDTSTGADIYKWKFAPRSTTVRNADWYVWTWPDMKPYPFGSLVQDGGAAAYVSFYDVMDRIKFTSPDDALARLTAITNWYYNVGDAGGYDAYFKKLGTERADMGLGAMGIGSFYTNAAMVPCSYIYGFLGLRAAPEGLIIQPKLPKNLPFVGIDNITYHGAEFKITAQKNRIEVVCKRNPAKKSFVVSGRRFTGTFEKAVDGDYAVVSESK